jgi:hypothetical protein
MEISVRKITDFGLLKECLEFAYGIEESKLTEELAYFREHSIIRTQMFIIKMKEIPTKASVHLVRHAAVGQFHLVGSNRADWKKAESEGMTEEEWDESINRNTPVNHVMILNAQHLIEMSRKRLCLKAEKATRRIVTEVKNRVSLLDPWLANSMVPNCYYRGGICPESKPCGMQLGIIQDMICQVPEKMYRDARNAYAIAEAKGGVN